MSMNGIYSSAFNPSHTCWLIVHKHNTHQCNNRALKKKAVDGHSIQNMETLL